MGYIKLDWFSVNIRDVSQIAGLNQVINAFSLESLRRRVRPTNSVPVLARDLPDAAVAVIIRSSSRLGYSLLLIRRIERRDDPWSGQIAFPGGHWGPGDNSFLETAIRETNEEVGVSLRNHYVLGVLPLVYARTRRIRVAPFVFTLKKKVELHLNKEVADAFWVPIHELEVSKVMRRKVPVTPIMVDSYVIGEKVIWGLTFRIIRLLLGENGS